MKLLIHKEGSTDDDRRKVLSIELIMKCEMEEYFKDLLLSNKFKDSLCSLSCKLGYLKTLKWARRNECPWNRKPLHISWRRYYNTCSPCTLAARYGHLRCLQYAHESGCKWDSDTCRYAAYSGHLDCLQWARENGCEWDSATCSSAAESGHLKCLQWARENGCEWDREHCLAMAKESYYYEVIIWIETTSSL